MNTHVQRWGNSLAVRIPKSLAETLGLGANDEVTIRVQDGQLILTPVQPRPYELDDLLAGITPENRHDQWETDAAVGNEAW